MPSRRVAIVCMLAVLLTLTGGGLATALADAPAGGLNVIAPSTTAPAAKIHQALLDRIADEGEPVKAWVFFTDKGYADEQQYQAAIDAVAASYNPRAVCRRQVRSDAARRGEPIFGEWDLPVVPQYAAAGGGNRCQDPRHQPVGERGQCVRHLGAGKAHRRTAVRRQAAARRPVARRRADERAGTGRWPLPRRGWGGHRRTRLRPVRRTTKPDLRDRRARRRLFRTGCHRGHPRHRLPPRS